MKKVLYLFVFLFSLFMLDNTILAWSEYKVGDIVPINEMDFYVIKDSGSNEDSVSLLKKEPLSYDEVIIYSEAFGQSLEILNQNGYGEISYYINENCSALSGRPPKFGGCSTNYTASTIKNIIDTWVNDAINLKLKDARLLSIEELLTNLGYDENKTSIGNGLEVTENVPKWIYDNNYQYWTSSSFHDSLTNVWIVKRDGSLGNDGIYNFYSVIRPVITLSKTALGDKDESNKEENITNNESNNNTNIVDNTKSNNISSTKVKVENTYMSQSIIIIILGFIIGCTSLTLYYIIRKKEGK